MTQKELSLVQRVDFLLESCSGKKVLHLGCTNSPYTQDAIDSGMLLHDQLASVAGELYGIDSDAEAVAQLSQRGTQNVVVGDLEHLDAAELDRTFDVIIAGEIIEHLNNPGLFLTGVKRFMASGSYLIITTINAYCGMRFFRYGIRGRGGTAEPVHPDHVAYYSYSTLRLLLERHSLHIEQFLFYDIGREHRPHNRPILNAVNDVCVRFAPQLADGLIAVCRLR